nr:hypothetical protein [Micromonospora sp. DSM 115978]
MRRLGTALILAVIATILTPPDAARAAGHISAISISPASVRDGASAQATVTLVYPDTVDNTVIAWSSDPSVATVPSTTVIPAGATSVTFPVATNAAAPETIVMITAAVGNVTRSAYLMVNAVPPAGPALSTVSLTPTAIVAGGNATATIRFTGTVPQGAVVQLATSDPAVATVPTEVVVAAGRSSATFNLATAPVDAPTTVTVTADWYGIIRTATATVAPGTPPPADTVTVVRATYNRNRILTVEATGSDPNAILSVHLPSGAFLYQLTNNGNGRYSDQRGWRSSAPTQIVVRSNFGGSAASAVARI